jgi:nucleotide-binding universal stress UspA family protein
MTTVTVHPLGAALAAVFLGSLSYLFWWMFRVPPQLPQAVARAQFSVSALQRIVVPVSGSRASDQALELAARLGQSQRAEIAPVYVMEVPLTVGLEMRLPEQEARAEAVLAQARTLVASHGLPVHPISIHQRSVAEGVLRVAEQEEADAIVIGVGAERGFSRSEAAMRTITELLRRAPCEVIIARSPAVGEPEESQRA